MRTFSLEEESADFQTEFLLKFVRTIIENTDAYQKARLEAGVKGFIQKEKETKIQTKEQAKEIGFAREIQKKEIRDIVQTRIQKDKDKMSEMYIKGLPLNLEELSVAPIQVFRPRQILRKPVLRIPEPALPPTVSYLKPVPTSETVDVGKINILVQDPLVRVIECSGPDENVFVSGIMGRKPTEIKLTEDEIEEILGKFSKASKIPVNEGLFKAAIGNTILSAVVSDIVGIKFVIRKISG